MKRRLLRWGVIALLLAGLGFALGSAYFAREFTGPFNHPVGAVSADFGWPAETVQFPASDDGVMLAGWFVPCPDAIEAVVLLHGYKSDRRMMLARAKWFRSLGYAVLLYDARGHGESAGTIVSCGWWETRDLRGALGWLRGRGFKAFGCVGVSQGGATIALTGAKLSGVRWAVLESAYPTLANALDRRFRLRFGLPGWLAGGLMIPMAEWRLGVKVEAIAPDRHIAEFPCPLLLLNGERDRHTMPADAAQLYAGAKEPKSFWLVPGAAHEDLEIVAHGEYERRLQSFLNGVHASARGGI